MTDIDDIVARVSGELIPAARIESVHPREPIVVHELPEPWQVVGCGNYAAVFAHPSWPDWVVKVYAPGRPGLEDEALVYQALGEHGSYSRCAHVGSGWLLLARLRGRTFFEHLLEGLPIPRAAVEDIDAALDHARARGLFPHDVHAKNVMVGADGRGLVVDVSDFRQDVPCARWDHLKRAYYWVYLPVFARRPPRLPLWLLDGVRRGYRTVRGWLGAD